MWVYGDVKQQEKQMQGQQQQLWERGGHPREQHEARGGHSFSEQPTTFLKASVQMQPLSSQH